MQKKVLVPLAPGVEEIEAVGIIDVLRRAGIKVVPAAIGSKKLTASRGVVLIADVLWSKVSKESFDAIILPGGYKGTQALLKTRSLLSAIKNHASRGCIIGAICAAPLVLKKTGLITERHVTCHPAVRKELNVRQYINKKVVADGKIVTGQGPGAVFAFALKIVEMLNNKNCAVKISTEMVVS